MSDETIRARLKAALPTAMKARDREAVAALRETLAALDNAQAVDASAVELAAVEHARIAGSAGELGAAEVPRAALAEEQARALVTREIEERRAAARDYDGHGRPQEAERLRAQAELLAGMLA